MPPFTASLADPEEWRGKRVVITGGTGFIGSYLVERLAPLAAKIIVPTRRPEPARHFAHLTEGPHACEVRVGDLLDRSFAESLCEGADVVMLLAASVGGIEYNIKHPGSIFRDNIQVYLNTLEAARIHRVPRLLVTSSACVYPRDVTIPTPESEGFRERPEPTNEGYGWSKRMEEFLAEKYAAEFGMSIAVARPYNAYGPRDNFAPESSHVIPALVRKVFDPSTREITVWGSGKQSRSFLYVTDFVDGLIRVCEVARDPLATNVGADDETTIGETVRIIAEIAKSNKPIVFDTTKPEGQPRRKCDVTKLERDFAFRARVDIRRGLEETVAYYRQHVFPHERF